MKQIRKWQEYISSRLNGRESIILSDRLMNIKLNDARAAVYLEDGTFWLEIFDDSGNRVWFTQEHSANDVIAKMDI